MKQKRSNIKIQKLCKICNSIFEVTPCYKDREYCKFECYQLYKKTDEYRQHLSTAKKNRTIEQTQETREKQEKTMLKRYGVKHNWASKDDSINGRGGIRKKYGGIGLGSKEIMETVKQTKLEKYGNEHYCNSEKYKETYANYSEERKEEIRQARRIGLVKKFGVTCYYESEGYQNLYKDEKWCERRLKRIYDTKKKNGTFKTSKPELQIKKLLEEKFPNLEYQYRNKERYPFICDFYIPQLDLFIEYQGLWTHGKKPFESTIEDLQELELWKERAKKSKFYANAIEVWTLNDPLKRKVVKENNLNWIEFFTFEQFMEWYDVQ